MFGVLIRITSYAVSAFGGDSDEHKQQRFYGEISKTTVKFLNFSTPEKFALIILKLGKKVLP